MITLRARHASPSTIRADVAALFIAEDKDLFRLQTQALRDIVGKDSSPLDDHVFTGKAQQTLLLYPRSLGMQHLLLVGIGKLDHCGVETLRRGAAVAARAAGSLKAATLALLEPHTRIIDRVAEEVQGNAYELAGVALGEGAALSLYQYDRYISDPERRRARLRVVTLVGATRRSAQRLAEGVALARVTCEATWLARDLANAPGNELFPASLAQRAILAGKRNRFTTKVFNEKGIRRLKMGGLLGVSQGSAKPPRFIVMEHNRRAAGRGTVVLVGKGITFDSGGISIKPSSGMSEMKMDMSGGAAVIGVMQAAARLRLPLHIVGLVPASENLPGGAALKPGDIIVHANGRTSEVDNTDAEGRLILADALSYASRYRPDLVIDLATLTGACVVALGHFASGMMGNDAPSMRRLEEAGKRTYERVWELPMYEEYERLVKSDIADVKNTGGRWAGAITAAMFLKKFIGSYKWIHLDIAGTAMMEEPMDYIPKGGSGVGVRLLVDFLRHWRRQ